MPELGAIAPKIRSKNAGPFWLTVDIFCETPETFARVRDALATARIAAVAGVPEQEVKRFDIASLNVVKFSLPRPQRQGSVADRDMHGASWAALLAEIAID